MPWPPLPLSTPLSLIIFTLVLVSGEPAEFIDYSSSSASTKYCYSCMSEEFLVHWNFLQEVYYRPMNFTDHCFSIPAKINIGMVPCSHSMCVTVIEPRILAGQHVGNNIIRGCFSGVFRYGATPRAQASAIMDTSCSRMSAKQLLPPHMASRSSNRTVELCYCVGQLCNDYPSVAINSDRCHSSMASLLILLFWVLR